MPQKGFVVELNSLQVHQLRKILKMADDAEMTPEFFADALQRLAKAAGISESDTDVHPEVKASLGDGGGKHPLVADAERRAKAAAQ